MIEYRCPKCGEVAALPDVLRCPVCGKSMMGFPDLYTASHLRRCVREKWCSRREKGWKVPEEVWGLVARILAAVLEWYVRRHRRCRRPSSPSP